MAWEDLIIGLIQAIVEGVILAFVLSKYEEATAKKKEFREINYIMKKFYTLFKKKATMELYYFVKMLSDDERKYLKRVLVMEVNFTTKKGTTTEYQDVLEMKNADFIFVINPEMTNYHRLKNMKIDNTYDFKRPEEFIEIYNSYDAYIQSCCKEFGVNL